MIPIFICVRDLLDSPKKLAEQVAALDHGLPMLVNLASSYPPTQAWLQTGQFPVFNLGNAGNRAVWDAGLVLPADRHERLYGSRYFGVSDGDIDLDAIPTNLLTVMSELLDSAPHIEKVAVSLRLDDLPDFYQDKQRVIDHESQFWSNLQTWSCGHEAYVADADTHFVLYRAGTAWRGYSSLRTASPYVARHTPWYWNPAALPPDVRWYLDHMDTQWATWSTRMRIHTAEKVVAQ